MFTRHTSNTFFTTPTFSWGLGKVAIIDGVWIEYPLDPIKICVWKESFFQSWKFDFSGPDHHSPFDEFRPFPATLGQQQQQPLKLLHHNHHNNSNSREYLNFIHHAAAGHRQHHHHHRGPQQQQQQPVRRGSLEVNTSSRVMKLPTPPPPPNTTGPDGQPSKGPHCIRASQGPLDYCTLRHGVVGKQARAVQFADQQLERQGSDVSTLRHIFDAPFKCLFC